jgi:hypothetical protein
MPRKYKVWICGFSFTDKPTPPPTNAREKYKLEHRLKRVERRLEESRGTCMNMEWFSWMDVWTDIWEALGSPCPEPEGGFPLELEFR